PSWASASLLVPASEVGGLVVLAGAALDLLFLGQQALELGVGLLDERRGLLALDGLGSLDRLGSLDCHGSLGGLGALDCHRSLGGLGALGGGRGLGTGFAGLALVGLAAAATRGDDPPGPGLARRLADRHPRLLGDLVVAGDLVGEDVALVDPHLHADAPERRARLAEAVVDVGPERVQ